MDYQFYTAEDFITDENFIAWVNHPDDGSDAFWESWLKNNPEKAKEVEEARAFIRSLSFNTYSLPEDRAAHLLQNIHQQIEPVEKHSISFKNWRAVAAVLILGVLGLTAFWYIQNQDRNYSTVFNETREIVLPDGSSVLLNANSDLHFSRHWKADEAREVWLQGEAYFSVLSEQRKAGSKTFIVHTGMVDVEVLGTTFNVNRRGKKVSVVLTEGKVKVTPTDTDGQISRHSEKAQELQPGEMAIFSEEDYALEKKEVNTDVYTSWKTDELEFDSTSFNHLVDILHYNYGFEVTVKDSSLFERNLSGSVPNSHPADLIKGISLMFEIPVTQPGDQEIVFGN